MKQVDDYFRVFVFVLSSFVASLLLGAELLLLSLGLDFDGVRSGAGGLGREVGATATRLVPPLFELAWLGDLLVLLFPLLTGGVVN